MKFTKRYEKNYTTVSNEILRDKTVSNAAKGLFLFLWSCSDEFHITLKGLQAVCKDGRDAIRGQIKELEKAGYLRTVQVKDENGRFAGFNHDLRDTKDTPFEEVPCSEIPRSGFPNTGKAAAKEILKEEILNKETTASNSSSHSSTKGQAAEKEEEKKGRDFEIPIPEEVEMYVRERGYQIDARDWWQFYNSRGWKANGKRIMNWRKCLDKCAEAQNALNELEEMFDSYFDFEGAIKNGAGRNYPELDEWSDI